MILSRSTVLSILGLGLACTPNAPAVGLDPTTGSTTSSSSSSVTSSDTDTGSSSGTTAASASVGSESTGSGTTTADTTSTGAPSTTSTGTSGSDPTTSETGTSTGDTGSPCDPSTVDTILDGSFELPAATSPWTENNTVASESALCTPTDCLVGVGYTGAGWVWMGSTGASEWRVRQSITIAPGTQSLRFVMTMPNSHRTGDTHFEVRLDGTPLLSVPDTDHATYPLYTPVALDVATYADGAAHMLEFYLDDRSGIPTTAVLLDDVSLSCDVVDPPCLGDTCTCARGEFLGGGHCVPCTSGLESFTIISEAACQCAAVLCPSLTDMDIAACIDSTAPDSMCSSIWTDDCAGVSC